MTEKPGENEGVILQVSGTLMQGTLIGMTLLHSECPNSMVSSFLPKLEQLFPWAQKVPPKSGNIKHSYTAYFITRKAWKLSLNILLRIAQIPLPRWKLCCVGECHLTSKILTGETEGYFQPFLICRIKQQLPRHGTPLSMQSVLPHFNHCFNSTTDKSTAISTGNYLCKWIKKVRHRLERSPNNLLLSLILCLLCSWLQGDKHLVTVIPGWKGRLACGFPNPGLAWCHNESPKFIFCQYESSKRI